MAALNNKAYMANFQNILEPGHIPTMTKEYKPKVAQKFDKYLSPDGLKKYVLKTQRVQKIMEYYAKKTNQPISSIERKAREILDEIALGRNLPVIRWLGMCITAVSKRICSGIYVNETNLNRVKEVLGSQPVLYLPSHRSYCDFILMSYICFHYDIEIPGIAAGMDFYSMVGLGNMLRKTGAFFMRRSFSGDEFYWDIFKEYIYDLVSVYHIGVEFFIEGTRSRSFKALVPKIGLLSMAVQPFFMGEVPDIVIVPVSVSYERLLEEQLFVYELLGVPKPKESTKGFFKALRIIEQKFGRMYLDFGEPISVKNFFGNKLNRIKHSNLPAHMQKLDKEELSLIKTLANEVVYQQQRRIVITTFNLVALYFAYKSYLAQSVSLEQLSNGVLLLKTIFEQLGALLAADEKSVKMDIIETLEIHSNILKICPGNSKIQLTPAVIQIQTIDPKKLKAHSLSQETMQISVPILSLQLYINPCMFWLVAPSLIVISAMKLSDETSGEIQKDQLRIRTDELNAIFANEFVIVESKEDEEFTRHLNFLAHFKVLEVTDRIRFHRNETSDVLLSSIAPYLCCYLQLLETILSKFEFKEFTEKELLIATQKRVELRLASRAQYTHSYCLALDSLSIALNSFVQNGLINKRKDDVIIYSCKGIELFHFRNTLLQYCSLLPFNFYENEVVLSKL